MKVYIVRAYYDHEGCGNPVKGFVNEVDAKDLKLDLIEWLKREPSVVVDGNWDEFDDLYALWREEYPTADVFADKFIIEELEVQS